MFSAPDDDPSNDRLRSANLGAIGSAYLAAGARGLIVTGNVDARTTIRQFVDRTPGAELTVCRLRADSEQLRSRYLGRGLWPGSVDQVVRDAEAMDRDHFADVCVDTTGRSITESARLVRETSGWSPAPESEPALDPMRESASSPTPVPLLWLCGARGVGKTVVGYQLAARSWRSGVPAALLDLEQVGHFGPRASDDPANHRIKARNLGAAWQGFVAAGARRVVVAGEVEDADVVRMYAEQVPGAELTLCRLDAGIERLTERILRSAESGVAGLPNSLGGHSEYELRELARSAADTANRLAQNGFGDHSVDTNDRTAAEVVDVLVAEIDGFG